MAIADNQSNMIEVFRVLSANSPGVDDTSLLWKVLDERPLFSFKSAFEKQVRQVSHGRPLLYCNGELHMMQLLMVYANHFIELVEIFPASSKQKQAATIERQFVHSYGEPLRYYPGDDRQQKVHIVTFAEVNNGFFAICATQDADKFRVYDLQEKRMVHEISLSNEQKHVQQRGTILSERTFTVIYKVSEAGDPARRRMAESNTGDSQFTYWLFGERPQLLAAF